MPISSLRIAGERTSGRAGIDSAVIAATAMPICFGRGSQYRAPSDDLGTALAYEVTRVD